jgi:cation diffusion facilitator family transporter
VGAPGKGDPRKVVLAALLGNAGIAIAKFIAAWLSGSITMLAEGVHSVADTANQALLLVGMGLSKRLDPERYPLGRAKERYFWAFIVSLMLFFLGGVYAIYEGVHKLLGGPSQHGSPLWAIAVLVVSLAMETGSFFVAIREFNKTRAGRPFSEALFRGKDPTIPVVLLEDTGAVFGLMIALAAVLSAWLTGSEAADAIGSIVIGALLCVIGLTLARDTRSLLIGESVTPEERRRVLELARATPGVDDITQILTMHLGPDSVILALKVRFSPGISLEQVERITDAVEERIRDEMPQMTRIFIEADSDYEARLDPEVGQVG